MQVVNGDSDVRDAAEKDAKGRIAGVEINSIFRGFDDRQLR